MSRKTVSIQRRVLVLLIILLLFPSITYIWITQTIAEHTRWEHMRGEIELFRSFMLDTSTLLIRNVSSPLIQLWLTAEIEYSMWTLDNLIGLDRSHFSQLESINGVMMVFYSRLAEGNYITSLNSMQLRSLSSGFYSLGIKLLDAYTNFFNFTYTSINGPPIWYFGPAPPDETLLTQAVSTALKINSTLFS